MSDTKGDAPETVLREWRIGILNRILALALALAVLGVIIAAPDAQSHPGEWPAVIASCIVVVVLAVLTFARRMDSRIRAWGFLLMALALAVLVLGMFGLSGSGRVYLLALPVIALILVGVRSGLVMAGLAVVSYACFAIAAWQGTLATWLVGQRDSLQVGDWLAEAGDTFFLLIIVVALLVLFNRLQLRLIEKEHRARDELRAAEKLLEEQNASLQQNVEERTAELTIINSIGKAMVQQLSVDSIVKLVGDKVLEILQSDTVDILRYDAETNLVHLDYAYDRGYRPSGLSFPLGKGLTSEVIQSCQPLVLGSREEALSHGALILDEEPDAENTRSYLGVPIIVGDRVTGVLAVNSYREHAFGTASARVLSTLAAIMGLAIENARLLEQAQRLLAETEQRAGELAVINSVQQGLASKLESQAIVDLVGNKLCEVLANQNVAVYLYDPQAGTLHAPFLMDQGRRLEFPPATPSPTGIFSTLLATRQPVILNEGCAEWCATHGVVSIPGTAQEKSFANVPIITGGEVIGVLQLCDYEREHAFSDSDVRLMTTLAASLGVA